MQTNHDMTIEEIDRLFAIMETLSDDQKEELRKAILRNDEARSRVIRGFILNGDYGRAFSLVMMNCA